MKLLPLLASVAAACGSVVDSSNPDARPPGSDAAQPARCDPGKPFGPPVLVANVNTADHELGFALSRDELTAFVSHAVETPTFGSSILATTRPSAAHAFRTPVEDATEQLNLGEGNEYLPFPSHDALALYYGRQIDGDVMRPMLSTRPSTSAAFSAVETPVKVDGGDLTGSCTVLSADDQRVYWSDPSTRHLYVATRDQFADVFVDSREASIVPVENPVLSLDELTLYYSDGAETDILVATRATKAQPFGTGVPLANVNSAANDAPTFVTSDGCVLYLKSNRPGGIGGGDIWEAHRPR